MSRGELCFLWLFYWFAWLPCLWAFVVGCLCLACSRGFGPVCLVGLFVGLYIGSGVWFAFPLPGMWARFYLVVACWFRIVVDGAVVGGACPAGFGFWVSGCCPFPSFRGGAVPLTGFLGP